MRRVAMLTAGALALGACGDDDTEASDTADTAAHRSDPLRSRADRAVRAAYAWELGGRPPGQTGRLPGSADRREPRRTCLSAEVLRLRPDGRAWEVEAMIARVWRGAVTAADGDAYADYLEETGVADYRATPGNRGVQVLRREVDDRTEFVLVTLWDSTEAIAAFAGDDIEAAVYYDEDDRYLLDREPRVAHYTVTTFD
jgi:heme-degrading monooxygenase HmoA